MSRAYADGKYTDEEWLRKQYREKGLTGKEIAKKTKVTQATISKWVQKYGIERRWYDGELLKEMYVNKRMTLEEMVEEFNCGRSAIRQNLVDAGVEIRDRSDYSRLPFLRDRRDGHIHIEHSHKKKTHQVQLHRLTAVVEHGWEEVTREDTIVHHKNCIPWDNRPSNLMVMKRDEHTRLHANPRRLRSLDPEWSEYKFRRSQ